MLNIGAIRKPTFLTFNNKKIFNHLWLAFIKAPIFQHFNLESHIQIENNVSSYAISGMLNQLNLNFNALPNDLNLNKSDFSQWHPVVYFSKKLISAETQYKTPNTEFPAIVEVYKTWRHYLESCKYKVFLPTNCQEKANRVIDILSCFCQKNLNKKKTLS